MSLPYIFCARFNERTKAGLQSKSGNQSCVFWDFAIARRRGKRIGSAKYHSNFSASTILLPPPVRIEPSTRDRWRVSFFVFEDRLPSNDCRDEKISAQRPPACIKSRLGDGTNFILLSNFFQKTPFPERTMHSHS